MFSSKEIWMTAFEKAFEDGYKRGYIQGRQEALQHCVLALISTMGLRSVYKELHADRETGC